MKRILYFLLVFTLMFALLGSVVSFAEESTSAEEGTSAEESTSAEEGTSAEESTSAEEGTSVEESTSAEEPDANVFTRLYEFWESSKSDIMTLGGGSIVFILTMLLKRELGNIAKNIIDSIARVLTKTDVSVEQQKAIVTGLNEMVDGYNEIKDVGKTVFESLETFEKNITALCEASETLQKSLSECYTVIVSLMDKEILQNAEVMEVLSSVCANNSKISHGIKEFVALKRAENAKLVQEASELMHKSEGGVSNE